MFGAKIRRNETKKKKKKKRDKEIELVSNLISTIIYTQNIISIFGAKINRNEKKMKKKKKKKKREKKEEGSLSAIRFEPFPLCQRICPAGTVPSRNSLAVRLMKSSSSLELPYVHGDHKHC